MEELWLGVGIALEGFQRLIVRSEEPVRRYCPAPEEYVRAWTGPGKVRRC